VLFENPQNHGADVTRPWRAHVINPDHGCHDIRLEDLDGDGKLDIVCSGAISLRAPSFVAFQQDRNHWQVVYDIADVGDDIAILRVANDSLPIHSVMPGRCYRRDTPDARHLATFHQIEGLVVDRGISFADLAGVIETFTRAYFGPDIESRLRPGYFPFTEPSAEFEVTCTICRGAGCRTCSQTGWIELGGCGVLDPAVLAAVGIDGNEWSGFAFGFGIDRCAQMRHEIADMRALIENDTRFLEQFS